MLRIRLCEADRERFAAPEELVLDVEAIKDLDAAELTEMDQALTMPVALFLPYFEGPLSDAAQVRRVAVWLALRLAGCDVAWDACTPKLLRAEFTQEARPPVGASEGSSEDEPVSSSSEA